MTLWTSDSERPAVVEVADPLTVRENAPPASRPHASVVVCAYTERRWDDLRAAIESVRAQLTADDEIILVIDHNESLLRRAKTEFPGAAVIANSQVQGLSGARNTGIAIAAGEIVVFLDDDARAEPGWLDRLLAPYDDPAVMGVGGAALPDWPVARPDWFPPEFDWVVGCSYIGLPTGLSPVRNPIGASMSFRRSAFDAVGLFTHGIGRVDVKPMGCEETEFGIRLRRANPTAVVLYDPDAIVRHRVTAERTTFAYFRSRCYAEGRSKALVAEQVGQESALEAERSYVRRVLPTALWRNLAAPGGRRRAGAIMAGFALTTVGYAHGSLLRSTW